ncbi:hypothetical protein H483_0115150 [Dietzia sp. UCD-THP]|uniref:hypothetical protein n=1 Tax=Dietzia sp. UCD-THP TaxID=1292020 RepID=UPI000361BD27|nr:hypothetical protein [Dietzia sp. UCD-THP]EYT57613.1 hypothetical protein H483_0115150 [Dietzia sp. UCD-THP]
MSATGTGPRHGPAGPGPVPVPVPDSRVAVAVDAAVGVVITALLLAGLARPGFPLLRDWVATPTPPLSDAALGLGESAARAVPQDVAVAWATRALEGIGLPLWPLTGLLTAAFCVWIAVAAGALVRQVVRGVTSAGVDTPGWSGHLVRLPAVVVAVWNPLVVERLLQGHWSLLAGVAAVVTLPALLAGPRPRLAGACAAVAVAGLTPTGWVLAVVAAAVSLACGARRRARSAAVLAAVAAVTALPWVLATVLAGGGAGGVGEGGGFAVGGTPGVAAFAARAETGIGTLGSVVALGGIWNSAAVPPSRTSWWAAAALVLLLAVWAVAAPGIWRARRDPTVRATVPLALVTWLVVALSATAPGIAALAAVVDAIPAAGLLRDTQKFVAFALPATVLAWGLAARALAPRLRPVGAAVLLTAVAVAAVPDAPRVLWDSLHPVTYGEGWARVAEIVDGRPGDMLVLPAGSFRSTPLWAGGAAVLDPAPRMLDTRVLVPGDLVVGGAGTVTGEGDRAREATEALLRGDHPRALTALGVRWVLDERTSAGPRGESDRTLSATTTRFADPELVLYELGGTDGQELAVPPPAPPPASQASRAAVLVAHVAWLVTGLAAMILAAVGRRSPR